MSSIKQHEEDSLSSNLATGLRIKKRGYEIDNTDTVPGCENDQGKKLRTGFLQLDNIPFNGDFGNFKIGTNVTKVGEAGHPMPPTSK